MPEDWIYFASDFPSPASPSKVVFFAHLIMPLPRSSPGNLLSCPQPLPLTASHIPPQCNGIKVSATIHRRAYASKTHTRSPSSAQPITSTIPSTTSTSTHSVAHDVNPPPSTRPADLSFPAADETGKLKYYINVGRTYLSFYKTGLKNVYHNYRASIPLRTSLGLPRYLPTSPPPHGPAAEFHAAVKSTRLSRSDFQLLRRAAYDVRRLIPFSLTLIICGELTPFMVLLLGNAITPFTCRIPRQLEKARAQKSARKNAALFAHQVASTGSLNPFAVGSQEEMDVLISYTDLGWIDRAGPEEILRACAALGLAKSHAVSGSAALVSLVYRRRLRRFAEYLAMDDRLIRRSGGVKGMERAEVRIAVEERGGVDVGSGKEGWAAEREQRRWLESWMNRSR